MKTALLFIFSITIICTKAQVNDDFGDGDFLNNPSWTGDVADFTVNNVLQLQLNATATGQSQLTLPVNLDFQHTVEWDLYIKQDFSPSSSNYSRVYLSSDQSDLNAPLHGFYLQFGEALSNDAIELFRQDSLTSYSICRGVNGMIAVSCQVRIKVIRDSVSNWKMYVDYMGGNNLHQEADGIDTSICTALFAGVNCVYTSGNVTKFYFDDFYFGSEIRDSICPTVQSVTAVNDSTLLIRFSESLDENTSGDISAYSVDNGIGNPIHVEHDSIAFQYKLIFANHFQGNINYTLNVQSIKDLGENPIQPVSIPFGFIPVKVADAKDIVLSEIYFAPSGSSPLPYAEYVEIFNRSDSAIEMSNWKISDGNTDGMIDAVIIPPHQYLLLCDNSDRALFTNLNNVVSVQDFPSLNNDGDNVLLYDNSGLIIDNLTFDNTIYHNPSKDGGGWSVERIDAEFTCGNSANWMASASSLHGTPGMANSVQGNFIDDTSPFMTNVYLADSLTLYVLLSEPVESAAADITNYRIQTSDGTAIAPSSITWNSDTVIIQFPSSLPHTRCTIQVSENVRDCPGNGFDVFQVKRFGYPETAVAGDVIINELLYYCNDGSADFVELYNNSQKIIDLKDWFIGESAFEDQTDIKETAKISAEHKLLFPGEYVVLSENDHLLKSFYACNDPHAFINVKSMPDYNSDEGRVELTDNGGNAIDEFIYSDKMQFPVLKETRGVSLERISFNNEENNWHSAAVTAGYATPGYANSMSMGYSQGEGTMSLSTDVFSPDGDGFMDVVAIHYFTEHTGSVLSLNAFDIYGNPVRTIIDHASIGAEGNIFWDGLSNSGEQLPSGIYILLGECYDLDGHVENFKKAVFLTRKNNSY
jgi:hypothetical protein